MSERWDNHFLRLAQAHAEMSKDPNTKVGAVIVGPDREIRSAGFNGFPRLICDSPERLNDRDTKLQLIVHAECNALVQAARVGVPVKGCTLYLAATDSSGMVWGGPPCTRCTVHVIQAGIDRVVSRPKKAVPSRWHADLELAEQLLSEAAVAYHEVPIREGGKHG
jgi:dCMP deaminase